jgi:hypothetical protein
MGRIRLLRHDFPGHGFEILDDDRGHSANLPPPTGTTGSSERSTLEGATARYDV